MDELLHRLHLEAGRSCGRDSTCGKMRPYSSEAEALRAADAHNRWTERRHDVEPYPCAFCEQWHIGRVMSASELEELITRSASGGE